MASFQPELWVERAGSAVAFYEPALGATVLRLNRPISGEEAQLGQMAPRSDYAVEVTREEAVAAAEKLNTEHPERHEFRWGAREGEGGSWSVVRVRLPGDAKPRRLTPETRGKPQTPPPERPFDLPGGVPPWAAGP